jgi:hypothetical protein
MSVAVIPQFLVITRNADAVFVVTVVAEFSGAKPIDDPK